MIQDLDLTLKELLSGEASDGTALQALTTDKISFSVPDKEWRDMQSGLNLNIYLYDIRENRELRTNERVVRQQTTPENTVALYKSPVRVDCSYMISAWNVTSESGSEMLEHRLLSQVLEVLFRNQNIPENYLQGLLTNQQPDLPMVSAQKNTLSNPVEFWNALGTPYRPSINCVITVSMDVNKVIEDDIYTVTDSDIIFKESEKEIIGKVVDSVDPSKGISWAQVKIPELRKSTITDINGNFTLKNIQHSDRGYEFSITAEGYGEAKPTIVIPKHADDYTITMTLET